MSIPDGKVSIAPGYRFQWEEAQQSHVLLYPEGMITLNPSAALILQHCDGSRTGEQVIDTLQQQFPDADLRDDVIQFFDDATDKGWIRFR